MEQIVYVLAKSGKPLMPTKRCGKVRHLLKDKMAKIVCYKPFTIQLLYDSKECTQPLMVAVDPGRTNIGVAVVKENGEQVYSAKLETRNKDVPKLMKERKAHRRASRNGERKRRQRRAIKNGTTFQDEKIVHERKLPQCKKPIKIKYIKNTEAKFCNRKRPKGWLTPTARHLLNTHLNLLKQIEKILPITMCAIEMNKFDFARMENPDIKKWEYQKGRLFGEDSLHSAISDEQGGHCILCKHEIERYHHIKPQCQNGSDTMENFVGLCKHHHDLVHTDEEWAKKLLKEKEGLLKKYGALSVLNQIMPYLIKELYAKYGDNLYFCTGYDTYLTRNTYSIPKDHNLDAYAIGITCLENEGKVITNLSYDTEVYFIKQFRRHNRQLIHRQTERTYKLDGVVVAHNRRKRFEQKTSSLHDWYLETKTSLGKLEAKRLHSKLKVFKSTRSKRNPDTLMPGAVFLYNGHRYVLSGTLNKGNYYRAVGSGSTNFKSNDCVLLSHNTGLVYV